MSDNETKPPLVLVTRKPGDIARKLVAYATAGLTTTAVITIAGIFGLEVSPELAGGLVLILGTVAGYFTKDSAPV